MEKAIKQNLGDVLAHVLEQLPQQQKS